MIVNLVEASPPREMRMPRLLAMALMRAEIASVSPTAVEDVWVVSAVRKVGALTLAGHEVRIRPKLAIDRLMFLMSFSSGRGWRDEGIELEAQSELLPAVAHAFLWQLRRAVGKGLLQGYLRVEEAAPTVRGKIAFDRQIRRRLGVPTPVEIDFDEYTVDIIENRLLISALDRLARLPQLDGQTQQRVRAHQPTFDGVALLQRGAPRAAVRFDRRNAHYRPAVALAELILGGTSIEHQAGAISARGFLIDVAVVFEEFLTATLRTALEQRGGTVAGQFRSHLDRDSRLAVRPDIVWMRGAHVSAVIDAKYKAQKPTGYPHADVYRMLAYCTRFGLTDGHLIYAAGEQEPTVHELHGSGVRIHCHALNLDGAPEAVLDRVMRLAARITAE